MKPLRLSILLDTLKSLMDVEWIEAPRESVMPMQEILEGLTPEKRPSSAFLQSLKHMGEIGHIRGILIKLDEIATAEPATISTLNHLRRLAEDCDLETYNAMLEALERHAV